MTQQDNYLISGGTVVDGSGAAARRADIAIADGRIVAVGPDLDATARRTIDAEGRLVTPGWVDIHTHYDAQASWDPYLTPSSWHGVTTVVMGNCGVGFAPAAPDRHDWLIELMEGVEDIPGSAMAEGITWEWESFAEYLDAIAARPHVMPSVSAVPGMSSTPSSRRISQSWRSGCAGAKPTPQLPMTIEVTPLIDDGARSGSHVAWPS